MLKKIFIIEESFRIKGRGLIIVREKPDKSFELGMKTPLIIISPDGKEISAKVVGIEMLSPPNFKIEAISIGDFSKSDVPIGSTVYVDE